MPRITHSLVLISLLAAALFLIPGAQAAPCDIGETDGVVCYEEEEDRTDDCASEGSESSWNRLTLRAAGVRAQAEAREGCHNLPPYFNLHYNEYTVRVASEHANVFVYHANWEDKKGGGSWCGTGASYDTAAGSGQQEFGCPAGPIGPTGVPGEKLPQ